MKSSSASQSVSDYLELASVIYHDAMAKCSANVDLRDLMTIESRVKDEGLSFLTIVLPQFCKDFEQALAGGGIAPTHFQRFPRLGSRRKRGAVPKFLQGVLRRIFDVTTGELILDENPHTYGGAVGASSILVESVRQICRAFAKVELECTKERIQATLNSFVEVERSFEQFSLRDEEDTAFRQLSHVLWDNMVAECKLSDLFPKHGPGATAERISGNQKFVWRRWHERVDTYFPLLGSAYPIGLAGSTPFAPWSDVEKRQTFWDEGGDWETSPWNPLVTLVPEHEEEPVRVCLVPKTLKAPRVIAIEPVCMQFVQQGIRDWLYDNIERYALTAGHVNFRDQRINQRLALAASSDGRLATIDLSDASDRVPHDLALAMFDGNPDLRDAIDACRSRLAVLPTGDLVGPLKKFASMGSALCFPVESMYFYTIVVLALLDDAGLSKTHRNISHVAQDVFVYGDDIIVPSAKAEVVCRYLQKYNCKVNTNKSFWTGKFRESCGVDAYDGGVVTPIYIRRPRPSNHRDARSLVSWVATAHLFSMKGMHRTAQFMLDKCEHAIGKKLPYLSETSPGLGRKIPLGYSPDWKRLHQIRWREDYQRLEVRALVPSPVRIKDSLVDYPALAKCLTGLERRESSVNQRLTAVEDLLHQAKGYISPPHMTVGTDQLLRSARHGAVTLKHRWVPV